MKLQPASKKEIKRIAIGTGICDLILLAVLLTLGIAAVAVYWLIRFRGVL